jgi:hypothetical protein
MRPQEMERTMPSKAVLFAFGAAVALLSGTASAGPSSALHSGAATIWPIEQIDYRRCWTSDGKRHCHWVRSNNGGRDANALPAYGAGRAENYRVGTAEWYRAMERDGRLSTEGGSP